jgi:uncharacterized protein (TIGR03083 family)
MANMDDTEIWRAVHEQRASLADLLETLTDAQWRCPSLCVGWTVRDVAAHVVSSADAGIGEVLIAMVRARGNFNRAMLLEARRRSARPTDQIIADYRRLDGSRRHPPGTTTFDPLVDVLVHTQDIARPLDLDHPMPPPLAAAAATYVWSRGFPYSPRKRLGGFRFTATDVEWTVGDGPTVQGPMAAILLLLAGRTVGVPELTGDGAGALRV